MSTTSQKSVDVTAKPLTTIPGHEDTVLGIAYLPGGNRLVSWSFDKTVRIWDVDNGEQEGTSMKHEGSARVKGLAVTRDGKRILSGGDDKRVRLWDVETHDAIRESGNYMDSIEVTALSPDDRLAAIGDVKGRIVIAEMKEGGEIKHLVQAGSLSSESQHTFPSVFSVCFSPNGEKLACAVRSAEGTSYTVQPLQHESSVWVVAFSPSGEFMATGGSSEKVSIWRVPWWVNEQKQVIISFTYLPTPSLTVLIKRFWKSPVPTAAGRLTNQVKEMKKDVGSLKPQEHQTHRRCNIFSHLQEQNDQLRRQLDDLVIANQKREVERERLEKEVKALRSSGYKSHIPQDPHAHTSSSTPEVCLSSSLLEPQALHPTGGHPLLSSLAPSNSSPVEVEERAKGEKRTKAEKKRARGEQRRN
ncbi:hypothetical protein PAXINDRAFT_17942 [Paxillus involutus ATCC 200175]|uniref:WD40 repeat-like protein n=1 Tax=Paxillus involutus ATCC 200175 TaxID=664439 RepID=A0A0C9TMD8_PAXIN|nr:hypothetical protein PAXINDRAFT_17942 [Paxillus involutus ATCC 200175]